MVDKDPWRTRFHRNIEMGEKMSIAGTIYERKEMNDNGESGSVLGDIEQILVDGDLTAFEDYFGDEDPFLYL
jgi:hypothetical protein